MRPHPFLFVTPADIARARQGMVDDPAFAALARELLKEAQAKSISDLPPLERAWWDEAKKKTWATIYPEINKHTGQVPREWAGLALACARASLLFPEEQDALARKAHDILLGLSGYTFEFDHFDTGMNYTTWGMPCLEVYDILYDRFTPDERARLDAFFNRMAEAIIRNDELWIRDLPGGELNNHYLWHKLGRLMLGLFYNRPRMVEDALHGPKGVEDCLRHGFTDDGLWLEASLNYQFAATAPLVVMARLLENAGTGINLWDERTADGRTLRQSYDALTGLLFPDGTLPNIGDCYAHRLALGSAADYETLYTRFHDPVYAWLIRRADHRTPGSLFAMTPALPEGAPPAGTATRLWPEHNYVMLRTAPGPDYWTGRGWTLFASFSNAPVHQHQDKLSVMLFGEGRHWLVDCEARAGVYHAFSSAVQRELNRETLAHNTLLVDGASQRFPDGRLDLVEFQDLPGVKRLTIGDLHGRLYAGVRQLRTLIATDEYVLDFYQVESRQPHDFAWLTHVDGLSSGSLAQGQPLANWQTATLPDQPPWRWIRGDGATSAQQATLTTGTLYTETFTAPPSGAGRTEGRLSLDLLADGPVELARCGFPRDDGSTSATIPMRIAHRRAATAAWFLALYRVGDPSSAPVRLSVAPAALHRWSLTVERDGKPITHLAPSLSAQHE